MTKNTEAELVLLVSDQEPNKRGKAVTAKRVKEKVSSGHEKIDDLLKFAIDVVHHCGEKALSFYGKGQKDMKFDEGLVTEAELQLREFFQDQLFARFPDHKVYKTDRGDDGYTHGAKRYLWIYDPLDGVANFQAGIPVWGTSVALFENYWPVFGIFHLPVTGDLFHAQAGHKAMWGQKQIHVSSQEEINDESLLLTYSRFHQRYQCSFPGKIRSLGCTGAHVCYVAMGRAEAAVLGSESYKDLAAAAVILEAAGGKIYKMDGKKFFLSEYMEQGRIEEHLLVVAPDKYAEVRGFFQESY
jgi:myo-inositol-1(or 4)-monophosphatase